MRYAPLTAPYSELLSRSYAAQQHHATAVLAKRTFQSLSETPYLERVEIMISDTREFYKNILGRQAGLVSFEWWNEHLNNGGNLGDMALSFLRSEEYKQTHNKDFGQLPVALQVEELYKAVLGREADTEGRAFWVEQMLAGGELNRITSSFINSVELTGQVTQQTDWEFSIS